eukprot:gene1550-2994_t
MTLTTIFKIPKIKREKSFSKIVTFKSRALAKTKKFIMSIKPVVEVTNEKPKSQNISIEKPRLPCNLQSEIHQSVVTYKRVQSFRAKQTANKVDLSNATRRQLGLEFISKCHHITQSDYGSRYFVRICMSCSHNKTAIRLGGFKDQESAILTNDTYLLLHHRYERLTFLRPEDEEYLDLITVRKSDRHSDEERVPVKQLLAERLQLDQERSMGSGIGIGISMDDYDNSPVKVSSLINSRNHNNNHNNNIHNQSSSNNINNDNINNNNKGDNHRLQPLPTYNYQMGTLISSTYPTTSTPSSTSVIIDLPVAVATEPSSKRHKKFTYSTIEAIEIAETVGSVGTDTVGIGTLETELLQREFVPVQKRCHPPKSSSISNPVHNIEPERQERRQLLPQQPQQQRCRRVATVTTSTSTLVSNSSSDEHNEGDCLALDHDARSKLVDAMLFNAVLTAKICEKKRGKNWFATVIGKGSEMGMGMGLIMWGPGDLAGDRMRRLLVGWLETEKKGLQCDVNHCPTLVEKILRLVEEGFEWEGGWKGEHVAENRIDRVLRRISEAPQCTVLCQLAPHLTGKHIRVGNATDPIMISKYAKLLSVRLKVLRKQSLELNRIKVFGKSSAGLDANLTGVILTKTLIAVELKKEFGTVVPFWIKTALIHRANLKNVRTERHFEKMTPFRS